MGDKGDKNAARPPEGSLVETRCLIKGPKSAIVPFPGPRSGPKSRTGPGALAKRSVPIFVAASHVFSPRTSGETLLFFFFWRSQSDNSRSTPDFEALTSIPELCLYVSTLQIYLSYDSSRILYINSIVYFSIFPSPFVLKPFFLILFSPNYIVRFIIIFTQPLRSGRIWHKVNFLSGV